MLEGGVADMKPQDRCRRRLELSKPLLEELYQWAAAMNVLPRSAVGQARHYLLTQRKYLERYLMDGRLEISNNRAEHSSKPFAIDRKNFLFANTPCGAKASAVMLSLINNLQKLYSEPILFTPSLSWQ